MTRRLFSTICLGFLACLAGAQVQQSWVTRFNSPDGLDDSANAVKIDGLGNTLVCGKSLLSGGSSGWNTVKYSTNGTQLWSATYAGAGSPRGMVVDGTSNTIVVGEANNDCVTIKYNSSGAILWISKYNGPASLIDTAIAVNVDAAGNVYVAASSQDTANGIPSFVLIKYDSNGNQLAATRDAGIGPTYATVDTLGRTFLMGDDGTGFSPGNTITASYDASGNRTWKFAGTNSQHSSNGINYKTTEHFFGLGEDSTGRSYWYDAYEDSAFNTGTQQYVYDNKTTTLRAYDVGGAALWTDATPTGVSGIRANSSDFVYSVISASGVNTLVCHSSTGVVKWTAPLPPLAFGYALIPDDYNGILVIGSQQNANKDYFITRFGPNGFQFWTQTYNGTANGDDILIDVATKGSTVSATGTSAGGASGNDYATVQYQMLAFAARDDYLTPKNTTLNVPAANGVLANDQFSDGATVVLESTTTHGNLTLNGDGSFTYVPNTDYEGYDNATYHFTKQGLNSNSATLGIGTGEFLLKHSCSPNPVVGGNNTTGTLTLSYPAPAGGFLVNLQSGSSLISVPASVTVPQGQTVATYTASTLPTGTTVVRQIIASAGSITLRVNLTITPPVLTSVGLSASTVYGDGTVTGTVTFNGTLNSAATVTLSDDSNAIDTPASVVVPSGANSASFTVTTHEVTSTAVSHISASNNGTTVMTTLTLAPYTLSAFAVSPNPMYSGGTATGTVTLNAPAGVNGTVVNATSSNTSAATVPSTFTVPAGATQGTFTITGQNVAVNTATTITVTKGTSSLNKVVTVAPNKLGNLTINPNSVGGGATAVGTVSLLGGAPQGGFLVNLTANSSILSVPATVTVPQGSQTATFTISTLVVTATYTRTVTASAQGVSKIASITVHPTTLGSVTVNPDTVVGGGQTTGTVHLDGMTGNASIQVALSASSAILHVPSSVTVLAHSNSADFVVNTSPVSAVYTRQVIATYLGVSKAANVTVTPISLLSLSLNPTTVVSGNPTIGTVTLTATAPTGGIVVTITSGSSVIHVPPTVTVPAGSNSVDFVISTSHVSSTVTRQVYAAFNGVTKAANLTLTP